MPAVPRTILLVEDEPAVHRVCLIALRTAGYTVLEAADAAAGERQAVAHPGLIDLLVTDVELPEMSGPELAGRLVAGRPGLRVLLLSGYPADEVRSPVPAGFLGKPFGVPQLWAAVREQLTRP